MPYKYTRGRLKKNKVRIEKVYPFQKSKAIQFS